MTERLTEKGELPAGLTWSNSLVELNGVGLLTVAREKFKELAAERPDDVELQARIRSYFEDAQAGLALQPGSETLVEALGSVEDILPKA